MTVIYCWCKLCCYKQQHSKLLGQFVFKVTDFSSHTRTYEDESFEDASATAYNWQLPYQQRIDLVFFPRYANTVRRPWCTLCKPSPALLITALCSPPDLRLDTPPVSSVNFNTWHTIYSTRVGVMVCFWVLRSKNVYPHLPDSYI